MREIESNLRGFRSESGILMENAFSKALKTSGSANESRRPESNSDSSGSGVVFFLEMVRIISLICACLSIGTCQLFPHLIVFFVIVHEIPEERVPEPPVPGRGEVDVIALRETGGHPLAHCAFAAHLLLHIPKCAAIGQRRLALRGDDAVQLFHGRPAPFQPVIAV